MKKNIKNFISIILSIMIVTIVLSPASVLAEPENNGCYLDNIQTMRTALINHEEKCRIQLITDDTVGVYVNKIICDIEHQDSMGELAVNEMILFSTFIIERDKDRGYYDAEIEFDYYETKEQFEQARNKVRKIIKENNLKTLNDFEKIKFVYDYITQNSSYDYELKLISQTAYSCMITQNSVCSGINKYKKENKTLLLDDFGEGFAENIPDAELNQIEVIMLKDAISSLDDMSKNLLYFKYVYGYSSAELSEIYNLSDANIRKKIQRAKNKIIKYYEEGKNNG